MVGAEVLALDQEQVFVEEFRDLFAESCLRLGGRTLPAPTESEIFAALVNSKYTSVMEVHVA